MINCPLNETTECQLDAVKNYTLRRSREYLKNKNIIVGNGTQTSRTLNKKYPLSH